MANSKNDNLRSQNLIGLWLGQRIRTVGMVLAVLVLLCSKAYGLASIEVAAGGSLIIDEASANLALETLVLGDGAKVEFAEGVSQWHLSVNQASIGEGVVIDGRGANGQQGLAGKSWSNTASSCSVGKKGVDGRPGDNGVAGVSITMMMGVASIGSLTIDVAGGQGGAGGAGGDGQAGGKITRCYGPNGGNGGNGGEGGEGAQGGNVSISLWDTQNSGRDVEFISRVSVNNGGGEPGQSGMPGVGGDVVPGRLTTIAGPGIRKWLSAGKKGVAGEQGKPSTSGRDGQTLLSHRPVSFHVSTPLSSNTKTAVVDQGQGAVQNKLPIKIAPEDKPVGKDQQLKDEIQFLRERLDQLEKLL